MSSTWDVDELVAKMAEIIERYLLKTDLKGDFGSGPFDPLPRYDLA